MVMLSFYNWVWLFQATEIVYSQIGNLFSWPKQTCIMFSFACNLLWAFSSRVLSFFHVVSGRYSINIITYNNGVGRSIIKSWIEDTLHSFGCREDRARSSLCINASTYYFSIAGTFNVIVKATIHVNIIITVQSFTHSHWAALTWKRSWKVKAT